MTTELTPSSRGIRLTWWIWVLITLFIIGCIVLAALLGLRSHGITAYRSAIAELEGQGKIATLDALITRSPKSEVSVLDAWKKWEKKPINYRVNWQPKGNTWSNYVLDLGPIPENMLDELNDERLLMDEGRALLRDRILTLSAVDHLVALMQKMPVKKQRDYSVVSTTIMQQIPSLLTTRALANWLHDEACTAENPVAALDDLDLFYAPYSHSATLIEVMINFAVIGLREQAYLDLCLLDKLPTKNFAAWVQEPCLAQEGIAAGFDGERLLWTDGMARWIEDMSLLNTYKINDLTGYSFSGSPAPWWDLNWIVSGPMMWCTTHHDGAITTKLYSHLSARMRSERSDPLPLMTDLLPKYWGIGGLGIQNLMECCLTALEFDARHRISRLAVRIVRQAKVDGLPSNQEELITQLNCAGELFPHGDHLHLAYERLAPDRFRLTVSPTSPIPDFDDPSRLKLRSKAFGTPASQNPYVNDRTSIEIQLPKRLQPVQVTP